jgi:hypothetical protein
MFSNNNNNNIYMTTLKTGTVALIDGDSLIYFEMGKETLEEALIGIDNRIHTMLEKCNTNKYAGFLTQGRCYRYQRATTKPYKGNRKYGNKPIIFPAIKEYLKQKWGFTYISEYEADDLVAIYREDCEGHIICSPDKDVLKQVASVHFNYRTAEKIGTTKMDGEKFLWKQMLMGDSTDGIQGIPKIGEKTADKWLSEIKVKEMPAFVLGKYIEKFDIHEGVHRFSETFKLVYILKTKAEAFLETGVAIPNLVINTAEPKIENDLWG